LSTHVFEDAIDGRRLSGGDDVGPAGAAPPADADLASGEKASSAARLSYLALTRAHQRVAALGDVAVEPRQSQIRVALRFILTKLRITLSCA